MQIISHLFKDIDPDFLAICKEKMAANQDPSHDWSHVEAVAKAALIISRHFQIPPTALILAAITHDTYSGIDRVNHHLLSAQWVREVLPSTKHAPWTYEVALCCEQHRASYKGEYTSELQEAFASADRGILHEDSIHDVVKRSYAFTKAKGATHEECLKTVVAHMAEKFGNKGYVKWPDMYMEVFQKEVAILKDAADSMTIEKVNSILEG